MRSRKSDIYHIVNEKSERRLEWQCQKFKVNVFHVVEVELDHEWEIPSYRSISDSFFLFHQMEYGALHNSLMYARERERKVRSCLFMLTLQSQLSRCF